MKVALAIGSIVLTAAVGTGGEQTSMPVAGDPTRGWRLVVAAECGRCHATSALPGVPAVARERSCAGCHAWIAATAGDEAALASMSRAFPTWRRYVENVGTFLHTPDLAAAGRLDPKWVAAYLRAPYRVRSGIRESMIRTAFTADEAGEVAAWLGSRRPTLVGLAAAAAAIPTSSNSTDVAEGERLYRSLACATCHAFGGRPAAPGIPEAPDLAHARDRMSASDIAAFIADPPALAGGGELKMPSYDLDARSAARLRDYVVFGAVSRPRAEASEADLPILTRRVTFREIDRAVLSKICVHCHMDPAREIDGGPGNTGGLGYRGAGLDLSSAAGIARGTLGPDGRRVSVLSSGASGEEPRLLLRLRARHAEALREAGGAHAPSIHPPGMPLGLPPLDPGAFQLVRLWLAQGARLY